jgi:HemY protein
MIRVLVFLSIVCAVAVGVVWLANRPGDVAITWQGWRIETSVMVLTVVVALTAMLSTLLWSVLRFVLAAPQLAARLLSDRRQRNGQLAVMRGLVAIGAGDARAAARYAAEAQRVAANEPLTLLLRAQAAQICGDRKAAESVFRTMAAQPDTRLLGLHGLYIEARRRGDVTAFRHFAEQAAQAAPALPWAAQAVLEFRCADGDWEGALAILNAHLANRLVEKSTYQRQGAVLLTARALALEASEPGLAKALAIEATRLAPDLVPAAALAGRLLGEAGEARWAARILMSAWRKNPHPDLAQTYAHLRPGDSARDRLARIQSLIRERDDHRESILALARAALDAREFALVRQTLEPLLQKPTQRVAMLMAELEQLEHGDEGRVREWTARAVHAARDPAWTADGFVSGRWLPVSPVSGRIDALEWKVPLEELSGPTRVINNTQAAAEPGMASGDQRQLGPVAATNKPTEGAPSALPSRSTSVTPSTFSASRSRSGTTAAIVPIVHIPDDPGPHAPPLIESERQLEPRSEKRWRRLSSLLFR